MYVTQRIEIDPTYIQKQEFERYFGYSRYIYNKALETWQNEYKAGRKPNFRSIRDLLKENKEEWECNQNNMILETSCENVSRAFNLFFKKVSKLPKFKSKKKAKKSFRFFKKNKWAIQILNSTKLQLYMFHKKFGLIKMKEPIRFKSAIIKEVTIKQRADKYFASFILELNYNPYSLPPKKLKAKYVGVDVGIKSQAVLVDSKGNEKVFKNRKKAINLINKRISRLNRLMQIKRDNKKKSKLEIDSKKYLKMRTKLQRLYLRKTNIQNDLIHKITHYLVTKYGIICIEDLKMSGLMKNHHLAKSIGESTFYEFKRQMMYKAEWYGTDLIIAPKTFPSTQTCSHCGHTFKGKDKLTLKERVYKCPICGMKMDRDINAAKNLMLFAKEVTEHPERFELSK